MNKIHDSLDLIIILHINLQRVFDEKEFQQSELRDAQKQLESLK